MTEKLFPETPSFDAGFPMLTRRLRLGVVGGGRIAQTQAMAARLTDRWEIVAGALSSDPTKAKAKGQEWRLAAERSYSSFQEMARVETVRPDGVDAVMVTTPNHMHCENVTAFLTAGIPVLCDKPLTNFAWEAQELVELADATGTLCAVSYVMSCFAMARQAREIVASGGIGKITQVHAEFLQDWMVGEGVGNAPHEKWRLDPTKSGLTSTTGDIATHAAHLASFISGLEMTDLRAEMHVCGAPKQLEDTVFMMTRYEGAVPGTLMATRNAPGNRGGLRVRVFGTKGGVEWDLEDSERVKWSVFGEPDRILMRGLGHGISPSVQRLVRTGRGFPEGLIEAWANLYTEFALAVAAAKQGLELPENSLSLPSVTDGAAGVAFIEAVVRSSNDGGVWVSVSR